MVRRDIHFYYFSSKFDYFALKLTIIFLVIPFNLNVLLNFVFYLNKIALELINLFDPKELQVHQVEIMYLKLLLFDYKICFDI